MPSYKLTYFTARGYGEPARQLFHLAGVPFEDVRLNFEDGSFDQLRDQTPFGKLPVLTVDGVQIPQSAAICRYLARKFGFAGKTPEEEAWADAIVDQFKDFATAFFQLIIAQRAQKPADEVERIKTEVAIPARDAWLKIVDGLLAKSKSGWLVGSGGTWADLVVVDNMLTLEKNGFYDGVEWPRIEALREKVKTTPKLKEYLTNRPETQF